MRNRASFKKILYSKKTLQLIGAGFVFSALLLSSFSLCQAQSYSPDISIVKLGRNITKGESSWTDFVFAEPGDEIEFSITITSTGNTIAKNVRVIDYLPYRLMYLSTYGATTNSINNRWANIGDISPNASKTIYLKTKLSAIDKFAVGTHTLTNTAKAQADLLGSISDTTSVTVTKAGSTNNSNTNTNTNSDNAKLTIYKKGKNITKNGQFWAQKIEAEPGDEIEFFIEILSQGNKPATNVYAKDFLPSKLKYVSYSTSGATANDITAGWYNIGDISVGESKTIYFKARLSDAKSFGTGSTTLTNTVRVYADSVKQISDEVQITVTKGQVSGASTMTTKKLEIEKLIRNISANQNGFIDSVSANTGETVEFSLRIINNGNSVLENIKIWDVLPANLTYIDDSTSLDNNKIGDGIAGAGVSINSLPANQNRTIKFRAKIASADKFSAETNKLTNYAYATASDLPTVSDTAILTVKTQKQTQVPTQGQVSGATTIETGSNKMLGLSLIISFVISVIIYAIIRNKKELKLRFALAKIKFQEKYL